MSRPLPGARPAGEIIANEVLTALPRLGAALGRYPWPLALALGLAGLYLLVLGARHRRTLGLLGGAAAGWAAGWAAGPWVAARVGLAPATTAAVAAGVLGLFSTLVPGAFVFSLGAVPGAVIGRNFPIAGEPLLGLAAGLLVGGGVASLLGRLVTAVSAATLGAVLTVAALLASARRSEVLAALAQRPFVAVALAALLAVAGTAYQYGRAASEAKAGPPPLAPPPLDDTRRTV